MARELFGDRSGHSTAAPGSVGEGADACDRLADRKHRPIRTRWTAQPGTIQ